ncbi:MAG: peptide chain release factor N(5)-glutamine methyltransferase [Verrucomicrobiales bacterium]|nr:peptide chain release factor N(5)-glutamine methyltransferase [Verrucomicrobiales bacterium]
MSTVLDTLQQGTGYLEKYGVEDPRLNMQYLLAHVLKCDRMQVYVDFDRSLTEDQLVILRDLTKRRANGEPLQHLLGTSEFCGLEFKTDSRALIPRPETEELAEKCSKLDLPGNPQILDMGCGSGVIGISLAHLLKDIEPVVVLADISIEALSLAEENRASLVSDANVTLVESDLFSHIDGPFDLIVANLPYIPHSEQTSLSKEVQQDPDLALYGGEQGTEVIESFFSQIAEHIKSGGRIALEYGINQEEKIQSLASDAQLHEIEVAKDLSGINRFLFAVKI